MRSALLLTIPLLFSACCYDPVLPPKIAILKPVGTITVKEGIISGEDINRVIQLRKSESYYIEQLTKYNEEFTK